MKYLRTSVPRTNLPGRPYVTGPITKSGQEYGCKYGPTKPLPGANTGAHDGPISRPCHEIPRSRPPKISGAQIRPSNFPSVRRSVFTPVFRGRLWLLAG